MTCMRAVFILRLNSQKCFTRPIQHGTEPKFVPDDVTNSRETLMAKRKLNTILRSKLTSEIPVKIEFTIQVFIKLQK